MKGKIIMRGLVVLLIILLVVGIGYCIYKYKNKSHTIIKNPNEVEITIKKTAGIPFKWLVEIEDEEIIENNKTYVLKDDNEKYHTTGGHVYVNYVFKGKKEGKTTVTFKCVSLENENDVMEKEKYVIVVDKNLKTTIEE